MAAISSIRTIALVARDLGVKEALLHQLAEGLDPEDGLIWIYDTNRQVVAFTDYGVENLVTLLEDLHGWTPPTPSPPGMWSKIKMLLGRATG